MEIVKKVVLWCVVGFLSLLAWGSISSFACIAAILIPALIASVDKWESSLRKYFKRIFKTIAIAALAILILVTLPSCEMPNDTDIPNDPSSTITTEPATKPSTEPITEPVTEPATQPTTELPTAPATEPPTEPPTNPATEPATEPPTEPATEPPHMHSFSAATCTNPKTCYCGATEGNANGHSWKSATCTDAKKCSNCGQTEGKSLGHSYSSGKCTRCSARDPNANSNTNPDSSDTKVWITEKGKKYHSNKSCSNMKKPYQVTKEEAIALGRSACSKCY